MSLDSVKGRRWVEALVVLLMFGVVCIMVFLNLHAERRLQHEKALFFELQILRNSVNLYKVVNERNPSSLVALAAEVYHMQTEQATHRYVQGSPIDPDGTVRDPFGNLYQYDPGTGWLRSTTTGYEFW